MDRYVQSVRRPRGMIYFPKTMTNSFRTLCIFRSEHRIISKNFCVCVFFSVNIEGFMEVELDDTKCDGNDDDNRMNMIIDQSTSYFLKIGRQILQ